jgi:hypothetical protein
MRNEEVKTHHNRTQLGLRQFTASKSERFVRMPKQFERGTRMLFAMLILSFTACQNSEKSKSNVLNPNTSFSEQATRAGAE